MTTKTLLDEKTCRKCGELKPISEFWRNPGFKDGFNCNCRGCCKFLWCDKYAEENREKTRTRAAEWRQQNPEKYEDMNRRARARRACERERLWIEYMQRGLKRCSKCESEKLFAEFHKSSSSKDGLKCSCKCCCREYGRAIKEQKSAYARKWRAANPDKALATSRRNLQKHRDKRLAMTRDWRTRNPDKLREGHRAWRKANPDKVRVKHAVRRARKWGATGRHTAAERHALLELQLLLCANPFCRADLRLLRSYDRNLDHVVPLAEGGSNSISNTQWLCRPCNMRKRTFSQAEWLQREAERSQREMTIS